MEALKIYDNEHPVNLLAELHAAEQVIERNLRGYIAVGEELERIRSKKLYLAKADKYPTFEAYVIDKWNLTRDGAYKTIYASKAASVVEQPTAKPVTRSAAESLAEYADDPEFQRRVMERARAEHDEPNGKDIDFHASMILAEDCAKIPPKTQKKVVDAQAKRLRKSASRAAATALRKDERKKALRWAEKLSNLISEMESSGRHGRPMDLAADMIQLQARVKIWLKG